MILNEIYLLNNPSTLEKALKKFVARFSDFSKIKKIHFTDAFNIVLNVIKFPFQMYFR